MKNYYEILNIAKEAKQAEIKSAFKKLAIKYHPDKNPNNTIAEESFKLINEAYQTLSNDNKRWIYDQKLYTDTKSKSPEPSAHQYSTQGNATTYNKYSWTSPHSAAGDYSNQGKFYQEPVSSKKEKKSDIYILGITLFVIIGTAALLFGFMMNGIAAKTHFNTATELYENEEYFKALTELNLALDFKQDYVEAYTLKGDINFKINRYGPAVKDYEKAIKYSESPTIELLNKRELCKQILAQPQSNFDKR